MAVAGASLIRRRLRQRFGIAARKVAVRSERPWYWRALLGVLVLSTSLALAAWMYDAGRRFAGFDRSETDRELAALRTQVRALEGELARLGPVARSSGSRLQVEASTQDLLAAQIRSLQQENSALKEDLALFEGLIAGEAQSAGLRIGKVALESAGSGGRWRYRVLVLNSWQPKNSVGPARGELEFALVARQAGKDVSILVPSRGSEAGQFRFSVVHFQRLEGEFPLSPGTVLTAGEVRLIQGGEIKARRAVVLPDPSISARGA